MLDSSKAYQKDNISPKILKQNKNISALVLAYDKNRCIDEGKFPSNLKIDDVTPIYNKAEHLLKGNYRPVSIIPTLCKVSKRNFYTHKSIPI